MPHSIYVPTEEVTAATFETWLRRSRPGDSMVYHVGFLAADREDVRFLGAPYNQHAHVFHEPIHSLGDAVWRAYLHGKVDLVQRRKGERHRQQFEYIAIKRTYARKRK